MNSNSFSFSSFISSFYHFLYALIVSFLIPFFSFRNSHHLRKTRSNNGGLSQDYLNGIKHHNHTDSANSQFSFPPANEFVLPQKLIISDDDFSITETQQPSLKTAPSMPTPPTPPEPNSSFFSSMLSAAGNVLRGSSRPLDHKRSFSDGSFYTPTSHDLDDTSLGTDAESLGSDDTNDGSRIKDIVIEPVRSAAAIDTIGKGELSLESLGLAPLHDYSSIGLDSKQTFSLVDHNSNLENIHAQPFSPLDNLSFPNSTTPVSRKTIADSAVYKDVQTPTNGSFNSTSPVPVLVVQQPEPATAPRFPKTSATENNHPIRSFSSSNLSSLPQQHNSPLPTSGTLSSAMMSPSLSPQGQLALRRSSSSSSGLSTNINNDKNNTKAPSTTAGQTNGVPSVLTASALSSGAAPVSTFTADVPRRSFTSFTERDRPPSGFIKSPTASIHEKRKRSLGRNKRDASPLRLDQADNEDLANVKNPLKSPDVILTPTSGPLDSSGKPKRSSHLVGFAYANNKRNKDFHRLFRSLTSNDYLLDDFSCALSKDILVHGRMYVSEHNICFNSNILGWVTTLVIAFDEVVGLEKKMTAGLFPNAITIQTLHNRYSFASFISRDSVYEFLISIWKQTSSRTDADVENAESDPAISDLDDEDGENDGESSDIESSGYESNSDSDMESNNSSISSDIESDDEICVPVRQVAAANGQSNDAKDTRNGLGDSDNKSGDKGSGAAQSSNGASGGGTGASSGGTNGASGNGGDDGDDGSKWPVSNLGPDSHDATEPKFELDKSDEKLLIKDTINAPLGVVANLLFGNDVTFITKFNENNQKNFDLKHFGAFNSLEESGFRQYEYIKPINGSVGPKQTRCICTDTINTWDLESSVGVITSTKTPDVPSGNSFLTVTRCTLWWGSSNTTILQLSYKMNWSARSFLKGPIEKGTQDGQMSFAKALVEELNTAVSVSKSKTGSKAKAKAGKAKAGKKKKTKDKGLSEGSKSKDKSSYPGGAQSAAGNGAGNSGGGIFTQILDILMMMPFDYVPIPLGGLLVILFVFIWLLRLMFGGGSSSSDIDAFTNAEIVQFLMNSRFGGGAALGLGNLAMLAAAYTNSGNHLLYNDGLSTSKLNRNKKGLQASIFSHAYQEKMAQLRLEEEYILWGWIEDRSRYLGRTGSGIGVEDTASSTKNDKSGGDLHDMSSDETGDDSTTVLDGLRKQYHAQNLKEAIKLTEMRLESLKKKFNLE